MIYSVTTLDTSLFNPEPFFMDTLLGYFAGWWCLCVSLFCCCFVVCLGFFLTDPCCLYLVAIYTKNRDKLQNLSVGM